MEPFPSVLCSFTHIRLLNKKRTHYRQTRFPSHKAYNKLSDYLKKNFSLNVNQVYFNKNFQNILLLNEVLAETKQALQCNTVRPTQTNTIIWLLLRRIDTDKTKVFKQHLVYVFQLHFKILISELLNSLKTSRLFILLSDIFPRMNQYILSLKKNTALLY